MTPEARAGLVTDIAIAINRYSLENESNTPDFILAEHMVRAMEAFNATSRERERWYGKSLTINGVVRAGEDDAGLAGLPSEHK